MNEKVSKDNICRECGKSFSRDCDLKQHVKSVHEKENESVYNICHKRFYRKDVLLRHLKTYESTSMKTYF